MGNPAVATMTEGVKFDEAKPRHDLLSGYALNELARVAAYGSVKYDDHNWRKGIKWSRTFSAALRHLWAFWRGEDIDPESGMPHLAHAMWNCMVMLEYTVTHPANDDRWKDPEKRVGKRLASELRLLTLDPPGKLPKVEPLVDSEKSVYDRL